MLMALGLTACCTFKGYPKKASAYESLQLFREAADTYEQALNCSGIKPEYVAGLRRNAQRVYDGYLQNVTHAIFYSLPAKEVKAAWTKAIEYKERHSNVEFEMGQHDQANTEYRKYMDAYTQRHLDLALQSFSQNDLATAQAQADSAGLFNYSNEKVAALRSTIESHLAEQRSTTNAEKHYLKALDDERSMRWHMAYNNFRSATSSVDHYKDSDLRMRECLEKCQVTLAVLPFVNDCGERAISEELFSKVQATLAHTTNPCISIVDRTDIAQLLAEQRLCMSGLINEHCAAIAGKLLGAKYILLGGLVSYKYDDPGSDRTTYTGWEKYEEVVYCTWPDGTIQRAYDGTPLLCTVVKFRPATYERCMANCKLISTFKYKLLDVSMGTLVTSDVLEVEQTDKVNYVIYSGNCGNLYKNDNGQCGAALYGDCMSKRTLLSQEDLHAKVIQEIVSRIAKEINGTW